MHNTHLGKITSLPATIAVALANIHSKIVIWDAAVILIGTANSRADEVGHSSSSAAAEDVGEAHTPQYYAAVKPHLA